VISGFHRDIRPALLWGFKQRKIPEERMFPYKNGTLPREYRAPMFDCGVSWH